MATRKRNHNYRRAKMRRSYSIEEIARLLGVHRRTVHSWTKQGLEVIDKEKKPFLIMGAEIRRFLKQAAQNRKCPLRADEFYCPRCRQARKSRPESIVIQRTGRKMGCSLQVFIRGICQICGQSLLRFSSGRQCQDLAAANGLLTEPHKVLTGGEDTSVNTDMRKEQNK